MPKPQSSSDGVFCNGSLFHYSMPGPYSVHWRRSGGEHYNQLCYLSLPSRGVIVLQVPSREIQQLVSLIRQSRRAVVFTGAGISTESGIPDFRGPGGVWTRIKPIEFQDFIASEAVRRESWQRWFEYGRGMLQAKPNSGHAAVAQLVSAGVVSAVITQNVDNLHQDSGVPDEQVIELHGNATYARCLGCGLRMEMDEVERDFVANGSVTRCRACSGIIKSATISFGQAMPEESMQKAERESLGCDLFIVLGSSLTVFPAAGFPVMAAQNGAKLVIVNQQQTDMDHLAQLVLHQALGDTLGQVIDQLELAV